MRQVLPLVFVTACQSSTKPLPPSHHGEHAPVDARSVTVALAASNVPKEPIEPKAAELQNIPQPVASAATAPVADPNLDDWPDQPGEKDGVVRDLPPAKDGSPCRVRITQPTGVAVDAVIQAWISEREAGAVNYAQSLCALDMIRAEEVVGFACRVVRARPRVLNATCVAYPNIGGNANPDVHRALFESSEGGKSTRISWKRIFTSKVAACAVIGSALKDRDPQLKNLSVSQWSQKCVNTTPPLVEAVFVRQENFLFELPSDFWAWGNNPSPLELPISSFRKALTKEFINLVGLSEETSGDAKP